MEIDQQVPEKARNLFTTCANIASEEDLCSVELVAEGVD
jgi:hypothetical protein